MMKSLSKLLIAICSFWAVAKFCHGQTKGFQTVKIVSRLSPSPQWETPLASPNEMARLKAIFSQPFSYFGSGGQSYAFLSQDGEVVLKLFKMHNIRQYPLLYRLSLPGVLDRFRIALLQRQKQKLNRVFSSSRLAYTELKQASGLLFLNLNPAPQYKELEITLIDNIGVYHRLDLANIPFALQFRADPALAALRFHLLHKDLYSCRKVLKNVVDCLMERYQRGIADIDPSVRRNIGLLKDRAISIDIGSFFYRRELEPKAELLKDTRRLRRWLKRRCPELAVYLDELINEQVHS
jgi:hypothetical protein